MPPDDYDRAEVSHLVELLGPAAVKALVESGSLDDVEQMVADANAILWDLGVQKDRGEAALELINLLVSGMVDVNFWRALALGKNVHLPATDQYGPMSQRLAPTDPKVSKPSKGNAYGKVHSKDKQAPSDFMRRQGTAVAAAAKKIVDLEQELAAAREHKAQLDGGLKRYAVTCLLTEMRRATASVFAMGPAWTLLRAISGPTGKEVAAAAQELETQRILVVLHALRDHEQFGSELKRVIHDVCVRYQGEAQRLGKPGTAFDGPYDYEAILKHLKLENPPEEQRLPWDHDLEDVPY